MQGILHDGICFGRVENYIDDNDGDGVPGDEEPNNDSKCFYELLNNAENELYPGCKKYSQFSAIIRMFHIKYLNRVSNKGFIDLLKFIKDAFPVGETFPKSYYEAKKMIGGLGLSYNKIHACPNDCMLYRKEYETDTE